VPLNQRENSLEISGRKGEAAEKATRRGWIVAAAGRSRGGVGRRRRAEWRRGGYPEG